MAARFTAIAYAVDVSRTMKNPVHQDDKQSKLLLAKSLVQKYLKDVYRHPQTAAYD